MATRFALISGGILSHSSLQILSKSLRCWGWRLATRIYSSFHRLRSGDWLGHSKTLMCFFLSYSFVALAVCFGSLSCWNTHPRPIFNALADFNPLALKVHGPIHRPFDAVLLSWPCGRGRISVLHCLVCCQLFYCWLWSQLPWDHWQDPPV